MKYENLHRLIEIKNHSHIIHTSSDDESDYQSSSMMKLLALEEKIIDENKEEQLALINEGAKIRPSFEVEIELRFLREVWLDLSGRPVSDFDRRTFSSNAPFPTHLIEDDVKIAYIKKQCELFIESQKGNSMQNQHIQSLIDTLKNESSSDSQKLDFLRKNLAKDQELDKVLRRYSKSHGAYVSLIVFLSVITLGLAAVIASVVQNRKTRGASSAFWKSEARHLREDLTLLSQENDTSLKEHSNWKDKMLNEIVKDVGYGQLLF